MAFVLFQEAGRQFALCLNEVTAGLSGSLWPLLCYCKTHHSSRLQISISIQEEGEVERAMSMFQKEVKVFSLKFASRQSRTLSDDDPKLQKKQL